MMRDELIKKFDEGTASEQELRLLEEMIHAGEVEIAELASLKKFGEMFSNVPEPSETMTSRFYSSLAKELKKERRPSVLVRINQALQFNPIARWAFGIVLIAVGFIAGEYVNTRNNVDEIKTLTAEINNVKEVMLLTMLEKESINDRLKAVNLTQDMPTVSDKVTEALLQTLGNDENVNVRLAAIEALIPYVNQPAVRKGLINSISKQESPLVLLALSELMVALQEKGAVEEFNQILRNNNTPDDVRSQLKSNIDILI
ncbi:HEAT repeat domain-containing protein [Fulvivirga sedimenti]|uniref:HEAT repeat domain-containing protein n=1 Tax=Fulvivirga sedimenti TaxID=2879465 RepID=A0A9X1HQY7_9BACT|nr:HEAT repeat domain-containing protein [Fulvivirga sedimenti]MCA6075147.1 HEAT repeat domain-containing protein [Fulvivirga sedimenti]MCA6076324.1 HEAT repeat domain-containing protein [Fulvivirga sedimenti]MCA6077452.1 HEAT repeat domain-containing protein [Fulvivirga sedimenti]